MVDNSEIARINKLTFGELRNELANCRNNPVREKVIRNLMCIRYNQHLQKKIQIEQFKKEQKRKQIMKIKNKLEKKYKYKVNHYDKTDDLLDFVDNDEKVQFDENDFNNVNENKNELDEVNELFDSRNITEYGRDYANNNLMERLNIDMNLRKENPIVKNKKDFATPYSNNPGNHFAPFNDFPKSQKNDFSNYKQNKQNKRN